MVFRAVALIMSSQNESAKTQKEIAKYRIFRKKSQREFVPICILDAPNQTKPNQTAYFVSSGFRSYFELHGLP